MSKMIRQTAFSAGEVDQIYYRRTELPAYLYGAKSLQNMEVTSTGSARKRRPTTNLYDTTTIYVRLFQIKDKNGVDYIILAGNLVMLICTVDFVTTYSVVTPYTLADLPTLKYDLNNDQVVFVHNDYPPARIYTTYGPTAFVYEVLDIYPQPSFDFGAVDYNASTITIAVVGNVLTFTVATTVNAFTTAWIGGIIIGGAPITNELGQLGYAIITNVVPSGSSPYTTVFTANIMEPFEETNYAPRGSAYSIRQPVFTAALGYPGVIAFYQNRLFFGNTPSLRSTLFGSSLRALNNFDIGTGSETDALIYTLGENEAGGIVGINGGKQLEIFTENYSFSAPQDQASGLVPSTFSIRQQAAFGSNGCQAQSYMNDTYFVSKDGTAICNFHFDGVGLSYTGTNISQHATHLVNNPQYAALQRSNAFSQDNFLYFLNSNGSLTSFQFISEMRNQDIPVAALTPIVFDSRIDTLDLIAINNTIYFLKYNTLTNDYLIDDFTNNDVKLDMSTVHAVPSDGEITGLDIYDGLTVTVFGENGGDYGEHLVTAGTITINNSGWTGDATIGLLYDSEVRTMDFYAGPSATDLFKSISQVYVEYYQSLEFYVAGKLVPFQTFEEIQQGIPPTLKTGVALSYPVLGYNRYSDISITQSAPYAFEIVGIGYQVVSTII